MNKYSQLIEWIKQYTPIYNDWVFFNVILTEAGTVGVTSVVNERELDTFINGTRRVEFLFSIVLVEEYDKGTSTHNLNAIKEFENIAAWIEEKNENRDYPDFGDDVEIENVKSLEIVPNVVIDPQAMKAKYQGQFKITYIERR